MDPSSAMGSNFLLGIFNGTRLSEVEGFLVGKYDGEVLRRSGGGLVGRSAEAFHSDHKTAPGSGDVWNG